MIAKIKLYLKRSIKISIRTLFFYLFGYVAGMGLWFAGLFVLFWGLLVYIIIFYFFRIDLSIGIFDFWISNDLFQDILFHGMAVLVALLLGLYPTIKNPDIGILEDPT